MLCAGLDAGGAAACDPGSPLVSGGVLVGVMSWSVGCGRPNLPSIYSRISTARFWIDFAMNTNI
ncbi:hypothetical protein HA402_002777 [Bradysia odoriphaga]|nr:hypothetical protein HA402_002777 [Bradysia odoriphaga]